MNEPVADEHRIVITGVGVVSPNGIGAEAFADACLRGESGLRRPDFEFDGKTSAVGRVVGFEPTSVMSDADVRRTPRMVPMAVAATREALAMSGWNAAASLDASRATGVALGTGGGGLGFVEEQYRALYTRGGGKLSPFAITSGTHGNLSSELSIQLGLRGPSHVVTTGCTSSTDAIGYARYLIRSGQVDVVVAGGADSPIMPGILSGFERMGVVSTRRWDDPRQSSRPFSADRDGFVLGEGAWMFVLESMSHARSRGATVLAEIAGYGSTCDAFHRVQIAPDAAESVRAIELSLRDAGVEANAIEYVNLHGTSTAMNDRLETLAIRRSLGARADAIPMSATKSMIGHPQGACGAAGLAATVLTMRRGRVHPTTNLDAVDPDCDLDYVAGESRACEGEFALCNCIAFGSKNSAIVLRVGR